MGVKCLFCGECHFVVPKAPSTAIAVPLPLGGRHKICFQSAI